MGIKNKKTKRRKQMSKLINDLTNEHQTVIGILNEVASLNIASDEAREKLKTVKDALINHIKKEDSQLYPFLNKQAETNTSLKSKLNMFAKDMDSVTKSVFEFFDNYENEESNHEFAKSFGRLVGMLKTRIMKEEKVIYKEYENLQN
ncbi:MAG: hemerythrin domain-containing protein [Desulfobacterales bacterium]|nr:hemerythrin domain-containing protein [Desulfobacterales bacterium]MCP4159141.1 hemerythrin domain-containing protein [Deltaproteobacteria bacterium]